MTSSTDELNSKEKKNESTIPTHLEDIDFMDVNSVAVRIARGGHLFSTFCRCYRQKDSSEKRTQSSCGLRNRPKTTPPLRSQSSVERAERKFRKQINIAEQTSAA